MRSRQTEDMTLMVLDDYYFELVNQELFMDETKNTIKLFTSYTRLGWSVPDLVNRLSILLACGTCCNLKFPTMARDFISNHVKVASPPQLRLFRINLLESTKGSPLTIASLERTTDLARTNVLISTTLVLTCRPRKARWNLNRTLKMQLITPRCS